MATIHKAIDIDAPVERVFEMLADPKRLPEYAPGLVSVENIRQTEQHLGDSFRATYAVLVERMNEKNAERLLENLKLLSEANP